MMAERKAADTAAAPAFSPAVAHLGMREKSLKKIRSSSVRCLSQENCAINKSTWVIQLREN